ncbi:hypothetical protein INQ25_04855 [Wolbachia endosymbiont of Rhagoletis cerasi]|uniref:hypothetical protein n=1 Tax=Wolbachia endosymbiont of Rhagoletis cerasi TaxID=225363 RepID=UPI001BD55549|nr:hypothetical protein [Wolbachia endosymbiont of Rhagoletis cerasi]MBS9530701.1 hypothetical protein [Wolbachia endosymbiont of Rhagoletis cerasi]
MDEGDLILLGVVSVIGAFTGLGLSFTALSPLVIGGIIAAIPVILLTAYFICDSVKEGKFSKEALFFFACICVASVAIGVGLAAAATAIFPGAMLGMGSAALAGAVIGAIAPITAFLAMENIIVPIAEKVNEHIISPIIECFSSKKQDV